MRYFLALIGFALLTISGIEPRDLRRDEVTLKVMVSACDQIDSLYLFEFNGINFQTVQAAPVQQQRAVFSLPETDPRFYYVGLGSGNLKPLILGSEKNVQVKATCTKFQSATFVASDLNQEYVQLRKQIMDLRAQTAKQVQEYRRNMNNPELLETITLKMSKVDDRRLQLLDSLRQANPFLAQVVALNTYLSYQNHGGDYANEVIYFAEQYFAQVDWTDPAYAYQPWVYESWKSFTETLSGIGLQAEPHREFIEQQLEKIPADTRARQLGLGAVVTALQQKPHPNYTYFAKKFIDSYQDSAPQATEAVQEQLDRLQAFLVGGTAPDFTQDNPEGQAISLSDFRGNVVLIDFWASWCGPCRRENPNVVRLYEKYHDQGFEILGVSLDSNKDRWLKAIEADGLTWPHVSDLKGWKNEVAQQYGIRSIPHTILLDPEGKIIARNLRGEMLENKLKEVFGEE